MASRWSALLPVALLVACADEAERAPAKPAPTVAERAATTRNRAREKAPPTPPGDHPPLVAGAHGNWRPEPSRLRLAERLGPAATREQIDALLDALEPNERIAVLRAGLRLADEGAARAAAARLTWNELDAWESGRAVTLLRTDVFVEGSEADFGEFRSILGSEELPDVLGRLPPLPWDVDPGALVEFHRQIRAEHAPLYARLARTAPPEIATYVRGDLWMLAQYTDRHRDEIARAYIGETAESLPRTAAGLPPLLAAGLQRFFVDGVLDGDGRKRSDYVSQWLLRWLNDSTPSNEDAALLVACARADNGLVHDTDFARWSLLLALGRLDEPASRVFLDGLAADDEEPALAALARRGDADAQAALRPYIEEDAWALSVLLEADPKGTLADLEAAVRSPDLRTCLFTLDTLRLARRDRHVLGFRWDDRLLAGFAERALRTPLTAERLAAVAACWPGCRTRRMAAEIVRRVETDAALASFTKVWADMRHDALAGTMPLLEVGARDPWRARLRRALDHPHEAVRALAFEQLLEIGDPASGARLLAYWKDHSRGIDDEILRSPSPELEAHLRERAQGPRGDHTDIAVELLAGLYGLPLPRASQEHLIELTTSGDDDVDLDDDAYETIRALVLDRKPFEALAELLRRHPHGYHHDVGRVKRGFVRAYLQGIRERRDLRLYAWATGELAVWGDRDAIAEQREALCVGRYRWMCDQAEPAHLFVGNHAAARTFLIAELETNCCRIVMGSGNALEAYYGIDDLDVESSTPRRQTLHEAVRRHFDDADGRWAWSHVAGHYVPAPR